MMVILDDGRDTNDDEDDEDDDDNAADGDEAGTLTVRRIIPNRLGGAAPDPRY